MPELVATTQMSQKSILLSLRSLVSSLDWSNVVKVCHTKEFWHDLRPPEPTGQTSSYAESCGFAHFYTDSGLNDRGLCLIAAEKRGLRNSTGIRLRNHP